VREDGGRGVDVLDLTGRRVRHLELDEAGEATWDGRDDAGRLVPAGVHFVVAAGARGRTQAQRVVVVR
jgi:hypothetical protein